MEAAELQEKGVSALRRLRAAIASENPGEAAEQARRLLVEGAEIRHLYAEFLRRTVAVLRERAGDQGRVEALAGHLEEEFGDEYEAREIQDRLDRGVESLAKTLLVGGADDSQLDELLAVYLGLHDRWRDELSGAIDLGVELLGEARLGELWAAIQADEIAGYGRYDRSKRPWSDSFPEVIESAFTDMAGHLCGPNLDGEIEVIESDEHVELRFAPCGSGGRIRGEDRFGVTSRRYDWAWNKEGVCFYCVHCCVLQQKEPIEHLGMPVRVISPPTSPGEACSWKVYRAPELIPESAFLEV